MRRGARSPRGRVGPGPPECLQDKCFDHLVRACVACGLLPPGSRPGKRGAPAAGRGSLAGVSPTPPDAPFLPGVPHSRPASPPFRLLPGRPAPSGAPCPPLLSPAPAACTGSPEPAPALLESSGSGPGAALPLPALLFGAPAGLGLALALVLLCLVTWLRTRRGPVPPEARDAEPEGESGLGTPRRSIPKCGVRGRGPGAGPEGVQLAGARWRVGRPSPGY